MKKSFFATLVMFLSMALMAGGAGAQNSAFTDMSEVEHISVANGKITIVKKDGSVNVLDASNNGKVEYVFKNVGLSEGFSDAGLYGAISSGKVEYNGNKLSEVSKIAKAICNNSLVINELIIHYKNEGNSNIRLKNVKNIIFDDCFFDGKLKLALSECDDIKSLTFKNCVFTDMISLDLNFCTNITTINIIDCSFVWDASFSLTTQGVGQKVVDELKAFFDEKGVSYEID